MSNECGNCFWNHAGDGRLRGRCGNPSQPDKLLRRYVYWNFKCGLWKHAPPPGPIAKHSAKLSKVFIKAFKRWWNNKSETAPNFPAYK